METQEQRMILHNMIEQNNELLRLQNENNELLKILIEIFKEETEEKTETNKFNIKQKETE